MNNFQSICKFKVDTLRVSILTITLLYFILTVDQVILKIVLTGPMATGKTCGTVILFIVLQVFFLNKNNARFFKFQSYC